MRASEFAELMEVSCSNVLEVMYFASINEVRHNTSFCALDSAGEEVAFSLSFAGDVLGSFGVRLRLNFARELAASFLGEDEADLGSDEVAEVVGELANMLCGSVVSRMKADSHFVLTHPEPFTKAPDDVEDLLVTYLITDSGVITTWVIVEGATCQA
jgi:CheY-specific phosphatase CheX